MSAPDAGRPREVDWADLRRRLDEAGRAVAGEAELPPERARAVLRERARALARPLAPPSGGDALEVVAFTVASERYVIESAWVAEVFRLERMTLLPGAGPPLVAVTAWRGEVLPLLDVRAMTGAPGGPLSDQDRVLVLGDEQPAFGVLVDGQVEMATLSPSSIRPRTEGTAAGRRHALGVTDEAVLVLDAGEMIRTYMGRSTR